MRDTPTTAELDFIDALRGIDQLATDAVLRVRALEARLEERDAEAAQLRRQAVELREENQQLKETLALWRTRMDSIMHELRA